jgi:hypothetical protein
MVGGLLQEGKGVNLSKQHTSVGDWTSYKEPTASRRRVVERIRSPILGSVHEDRELAHGWKLMKDAPENMSTRNIEEGRRR